MRSCHLHNAGLMGKPVDSGMKLPQDYLAQYSAFCDVTEDSFSLEAGEAKQCYYNAYHACLKDPSLVYMEGLVLCDDIPMIIEHAWVYSPSKNCVLETTMHGWRYEKNLKMPKTAYFGIPFSFEEVSEKIIQENGVYGALCHQTFRRIEEEPSLLADCLHEDFRELIEARSDNCDINRIIALYNDGDAKIT